MTQEEQGLSVQLENANAKLVGRGQGAKPQVSCSLPMHVINKVNFILCPYQQHQNVTLMVQELSVQATLD